MRNDGVLFYFTFMFVQLYTLHYFDKSSRWSFFFFLMTWICWTSSTSVMAFCWVHVTPIESSPLAAYMPCQSSFMSLVPKVFKSALPLNETWLKHVQHVEGRKKFGWSKKHGLTSVIEECCEACGTRWRKRKERSKGHSA